MGGGEGLRSWAPRERLTHDDVCGACAPSVVGHKSQDGIRTVTGGRGSTDKVATRFFDKAFECPIILSGGCRSIHSPKIKALHDEGMVLETAPLDPPKPGVDLALGLPPGIVKSFGIKPLLCHQRLQFFRTWVILVRIICGKLPA